MVENKKKKQLGRQEGWRKNLKRKTIAGGWVGKKTAGNHKNKEKKNIWGERRGGKAGWKSNKVC